MAAKQTNRSSEPAQPLYTAFHVVDGKDGSKGRWTKLGVFFAHEDGQGGNLILDALPIHFDGRIVLRAPKSE